MLKKEIYITGHKLNFLRKRALKLSRNCGEVYRMLNLQDALAGY